VTAQEAIELLRVTIVSQGPDTANRHYGRKKYGELLDACLTIARVLSEDRADGDLSDLLAQAAEQPIEDMDDIDALAAMWLTADDIAARLRSRLQEERYWWSATG
jgi:hypothetical protein